ncbi:MAG: corrinoid protein [Candidatus Thorarchaeota archaeon]|nr:MAG: corrinoid protein [Candidatus Thorarchaeota archaeon]
MPTLTDELVNAVADLQEETALKLIEQRLETGTDPIDIMNKCKEGMAIVGQRFEESEYFLPELILSGEIFKKIMDLVLPKFEGKRDETAGKVLIGTVEGDIHDIGKNIVIFMLQANGFEVVDIGVDQTPEMFVEKIREISPSVVGMSALITTAHAAMKRTVEAITDAGLRDTIKIMIGGGQVNQDVLNLVGADAYGQDAFEAVELCRKWIGG